MSYSSGLDPFTLSGLYVRATTSPRAPKNKKLWKLLERIESLPARDQRPLLRTIDAHLKGVEKQ